jgi:UDP-glucose 4-epimerase
VRKSIKGANILVVGGAGFIGSHLSDQLLDAGAKQVVVLDNMFLGKRENLESALRRGAILIEEDAENNALLAQLLATHNIEIVFNLATKALNYSFVNPLDAYQTNVTVLGNLLELQRAERFSTLCHFSSSEVYGTALYEPMDEKHPYDPTTTYAAGKAAADVMLKSWVRMFALDAFIVRPFNNYGPRQNWEPPLAAIIPLTIKRILDGTAPEIHGSGEQSRDFIYVEDTVWAVLRLYEKMAPGMDVNISADGNISMRELVEKICAIMRYDGEIAYKPRRGADVDCHISTNALMQSLIDFTPRGFDAGLAETVAWYIQRLGQ